MSHAIPEELLRRFDVPGPRYTSYPTADRFVEAFTESDYVQALAQRRAGSLALPLSLYVHIPFCESVCYYCACNKVITKHHSRAAEYLRYLTREVELQVAHLGQGHNVSQLHLGGGTPNFLEPAQLRRLIGGLQQLFNFSQSSARDFSIELDPRSVSVDDIAVLAELGFNRASLGIQDFDPQVQQAINRVQAVDETMAIIQACRDNGMRSVNVDLIYGLPLQTLAGFGRTLDTVIDARPDRLAIYGYAHLPHMFKAQRQIQDRDLPDPEQKLALLGLAVERLSAAGYQYIGMDHFALPEEDLSRAQRAGSLHRNFMGYTTHADSDLLGLGVSAISHIDSSYSQNPRDLKDWEAKIAEGGVPVWRGLELDSDDMLRAELIQQLMCHGSVDGHTLARRHGVDFDSYFAEELIALRHLQDDGLVSYGDGVVAATEQGRPLLRLIAMCFDRYLKAAQQPARYSRAIG